MSHKNEHLQSTIRKHLGMIVAQGLSDPRVTGMITVTDVQVTPDRSLAKVFVSVMPESAARKTIYALRHASGFLQQQLSQRISLRRMPRLDFVEDPSLKKQANILQTLADVGVEQPANQDITDDDADQDLESENPS